MQRRDFFKTAGIGSVSLVTLSTLTDAVINPALARTSLDGLPANKFTILLAGLYKPVVHCPDLELSTVNVCDGSFVTNSIYPVNGLPLDDSGEDKRGSRLSSPACQAPIGRFYVQLASLRYCAYDLPGGTLAMAFTGNTLVSVPDTQGGAYLVGTIDLDITEATGVYQSFVGGHNKMVDIGRALADGSFIDNCFCNISRP
jgi:hypothetical protein